ncbi:MAG: argininosuccinate lyase, partial [Acidobacteriota bacterium]
ANRAVSLFAATLQAATFKVETLRQRAGDNFITVTELADTIVRRENLSFRVAHQIVGASVRAALASGGEITHQILQEACRQTIGREIAMTPEELKTTLSPENFVAIRTVFGGTAPAETRRALGVEQGFAAEDETWYAQATTRLTEASRNLIREVDAILES